MSANFPLIVVLVLSIIWLWHMSKLSTICLTCANFPLVVGIVPQVVGSVLMLFCWWDICLLSSAYLFTCLLAYLFTCFLAYLLPCLFAYLLPSFLGYLITCLLV